jgi:hypothetical protein
MLANCVNVAKLVRMRSHSLSEWFRQRPNLRMRCIVPVSKNGDTIELHAWYEMHVFSSKVVS